MREDRAQYGRLHCACTAGGPPTAASVAADTDVERVLRDTFSPILVAVTAPLVLAFLALELDADPHAFATVTNLCYVGVAVHREIVSYAEKRSAHYLLGQLGAASMLLILLGACSLAHHRNPGEDTAELYFDLLLGKLLVFHVAFVTLSTVLLRVVPRGQWRVVRTFLVSVLIVTVFLLVINFETLVDNELYWYVPASTTAAVAGTVLRFGIAKRESVALLVALAEVAALLSIAAAAGFMQCRLFGRRVIGWEKEDYDLYHGLWHYLLSFTVGVLYERAADATHLDARVGALSTWDALSLLGITTLAGTAVVLKETNADMVTARIVLMVEAAVLGLFSFARFVAYLRSGVVWEHACGRVDYGPRSCADSCKLICGDP